MTLALGPVDRAGDRGVLGVCGTATLVTVEADALASPVEADAGGNDEDFSGASLLKPGTDDEIGVVAVGNENDLVGNGF